MKSVKKALYMPVTMVAAILSAVGLTGCSKRYVGYNAAEAINRDFSAVDERQLSLEDRDYVVTLTIDELDKEEFMYRFNFVTADLTEYKGDSENLLGTSEYTCESNSLEAALDKYYDETERQLDLGHMSDIVINDNEPDVKSNQLIFEMSNLPGIAKSVPTKIVTARQSEELILRELIKKVYAGEEF